MPRQDPNLDITEEEWKTILLGVPQRASVPNTPAPATPEPRALRTVAELAQLFPRQRTDIACRLCGSGLILKDGRRGLFYGCNKWSSTGCKGSCNSSPTGEPIGYAPVQLFRGQPGSPSPEVQRVQQEAQSKFNRIWMTGKMKRKEAYAWLSATLGVPNAQFVRLDIETCQRAIRAIDRELNPIDRFQMMDELEW